MQQNGKYTTLKEGDRIYLEEIPHIGFHVTVGRGADTLDFPHSPDNKKIVYGTLENFRTNVRDFNCLGMEETDLPEGATPRAKAYVVVPLAENALGSGATSKL